jgi:hypothetical protein
MGFDTVYAMSDREDDLRLGVNSSAIFFGDNATNAVGFFFVGTVGLLTAMGINLDLHMGFWMAISAAAILWFLQYSQLRKADIPKLVYGQIFRQNVWVGFVILAGWHSTESYLRSWQDKIFPNPLSHGKTGIIAASSIGLWNAKPGMVTLRTLASTASVAKKRLMF